MYRLHYAPDNASLIIRLVLEEAGIAYETVLVDRATRQQDSQAFRELNPAGLIPVLETPDGPVFETGAILLWLADRHGLAPGPQATDRGVLLKWLFFLSNTAHADLRQLFYPGLYVPASATGEHHAILSARMRRHFGLLDAAAVAEPGVFRATGLLAPYVAALMRWSVLYPKGQPQWFHMSNTPHLARLARGVESLTSARKIARLEGLGDQPFSSPDYAVPLEGVAT
jgi:glutathione S-transferase